MNLNKNSLHRLIDILPESETFAALRFLHFLASQVTNIPEDLLAEIDIMHGKETVHESIETLKTHLAR
jgi:hypothetical protein